MDKRHRRETLIDTGLQGSYAVEPRILPRCCGTTRVNPPRVWRNGVAGKKFGCC